MFTVIDQGRATEVDARVDGERVRLSPDALRRALGWEVHDGTLGPLDLAEVAGAHGRPLALDVAEGAAYVGAAAGERAQALASLVAPDFTLPDLAGRSHTLSAYRGQKILLVAWASW
jgi:hypothetical protein